MNCIKIFFYTLQIEENTKQMYSDSQGQHSSAVSDPRRRSSGWKVGARNALLQWCKEIITPKFGIHVENFGSSWRDGRAFVALISALNPGNVTLFQTSIFVQKLNSKKLFKKGNSTLEIKMQKIKEFRLCDFSPESWSKYDFKREFFDKNTTFEIVCT